MTTRNSPQHTPGKLTLFKSPVADENRSLDRPLAEVNHHAATDNGIS
jgi:hypothetical protein